MSGDWVLHYSWGCGNYSQANVTFNNDGTFSGPGPGKWRQREGTLLLSFDTGPAKYGGTVDGNVGSGAMSTFGGLNGCWDLTKQGTVGISAEAAVGAKSKQAHDACGCTARTARDVTIS